MREFLIVVGWMAALLIVGSAIGITATSQLQQRNTDVLLEPQQKVLGVNVDENYRLFVTTRTMRVDESPEVVHVYMYPGNVKWTIHECR